MLYYSGCSSGSGVWKVSKCLSWQGSIFLDAMVKVDQVRGVKQLSPGPAVFTLLRPSLGGKLARMIVYKNLSKCLDHIPRCLIWPGPGPQSLNWNTEETPNMRKPRNFAKTGVYFQHSQSLSYLLL